MLLRCRLSCGDSSLLSPAFAPLLPRKPVDPVTKGVKSTACCPCNTWATLAMALAMAIVMSVALPGAFMRPMARLTKMGRRIGGRLIQRSIATSDIGDIIGT